METINSEKSIAYPYCVISDIHCHNWSQFSHPLESGRNNRLQQILDAIDQAVTHLAKVGGRDLVITGDLFHTRGNVKPSVLNPTIDLFRSICAHNIRVHAIPGNHDLEGINSDTLGNALHALSSIPNFNCYAKPTLLASNHLFVPWYEDSQKVLNFTTKRVLQNPNLTLFAHVGLNDVVPAKIGNTLEPKDFLKESFKYVFCGHFHNHVSFDSRVFSVGALTHQSWSDVGSKAGYLIVFEDRVEQYETNAPKFVDIGGSTDTNIAGNYCRIKGVELNDHEAARVVYLVRGKGALGILDQSTRPSIIEKRYEHTVSVDLGIDSALEAYCKNTFGGNWETVYNECLKLKS